MSDALKEITLYVDVLPIGTITMWAGKAHQVPEGWHICDGTKGTPNLQDNFPCGVPNDQDGLLGTTQPAEETTLELKHLPAHTHTASLKGLDMDGANWKLMHPETYSTDVKSGSGTSVYDRYGREDSRTIRDVLGQVRVQVEPTGKAAPFTVARPVRTYVYFIMKIA